jgi:hypothetical protein
MQSFNASLVALANAGAVTAETALSASPDAAELRQLLNR